MRKAASRTRDEAEAMFLANIRVAYAVFNRFIRRHPGLARAGRDDDVLQDVLLAAFQACLDYDETRGAKLGTFIHVYARTAILNQARAWADKPAGLTGPNREQAKREPLYEDAIEDHRASLAREWERRQDAAYLMAPVRVAIRQLSPKQREAVEAALARPSGAPPKKLQVLHRHAVKRLKFFLRSKKSRERTE